MVGGAWRVFEEGSRAGRIRGWGGRDAAVAASGGKGLGGGWRRRVGGEWVAGREEAMWKEPGKRRRRQRGGDQRRMSVE